MDERPPTAADNGAEPTPRGSRRRTALSLVLLVVVVTAFALALADRWPDIAVALRDQRPIVLLGALALALIGVFQSFLLWRGTLAVLGSDLPVRPAARLFFVTQLGKYLPGAVWPVLAQMRLGRDLGVPRQRMGLAFVLTLGLATLIGVFVGLMALPALLRAEGAVVLLGLLALPLLGLLLVPRVLNTLLDTGLRVIRRPPLDTPLTSRDITRGVGWTLAFWVVYGGHVWLLAVGLGADPLPALAVAIGGFAIAFSLGPLLVVLPAGAGVREAVLILLLHSVLPTAEATAVALTSRGLLMATDALLALGFGLAPRRRNEDRAAALRGRLT
mgnify:CR=1 FL=1